jgi:hypothetical protein
MTTEHLWEHEHP